MTWPIRQCWPPRTEAIPTTLGEFVKTSQNILVKSGKKLVGDLLLRYESASFFSSDVH